MSKQLAISAAFSVLMMAAYVLFGSDAARVTPVGDAPFGAMTATAPEVASVIGEAGRLLPSAQ